MRMAAVILIWIALLGCAQGANLIASEAPEPNNLCALPDGWEAVAERDAEFVVFGERHGTREAPAFFGSLACNLARNGERILIGIEFGPYYNDALQAAWNANEEQFESLLLDAGWRGRRDGVGSQAMFEMLSGLHRLRSEGYAIDVVAFNGVQDEDQRARFADLPSQGPHEAAQAENIGRAAKAGSYDRVLVLVGNLHALKEPYNFGSGRFDPMARRLEAYGSVLSFSMRHAGGTNWSCQRECAANPAEANGFFDRKPFVAFNNEQADWLSSKYDGFYWVGAISASPPKVPGYK